MWPTFGQLPCKNGYNYWKSPVESSKVDAFNLIHGLLRQKKHELEADLESIVKSNLNEAKKKKKKPDKRQKKSMGT